MSCKLKSISVSIAVKLGLMSKNLAARALEVLEKDGGDHPTLSLLVNKGFLDEKQASVIRQKRMEDHPLDELNESVKRASFAIRNSVPR